MRHHSLGFTLIGTLVLLIAGGCSEPTSNSAESPNEKRVGITPQCQLGCNEPPDTSGGPGIYLGSGVNATVCFNGTQTDTDADGISDFCEKNLALAFAPQLAMTKGSDNLGREPKFAVKKLGTNKARIMYLLSYYVDRGPTTSWCNNNVGDQYDPNVWRAACEGHDGDSEWIVLDVYYNSSANGRWFLEQAIYSAHTGANTYQKGSAAYPLALSYPGNAGGYPRVYVAYQKHANYGSDSACDNGSIVATDECNADLFERVVAGNNLNLGSRAVHTSAQNCWPSSNPIYSSNGIKECYWSMDQFLGWHVGYSGGGSEYSPKLGGMGF